MSDIEITVPRLGWTMEEGIFVGWLKKEGESVRAGEPLFTLDGDKALQEIEATDSGTLHIPPNAPKAGSPVRVGELLGYLVVEGERATASKASPAPLKTPLTRPAGTLSPSEGERDGVRGPDVPTSPALSAHAASPRQTTERQASRRAITPRALRAANQLGIDWTNLRGTGRGGRIRERDVLALAPGALHTTRASPIPTPRSQSPTSPGSPRETQ